MNCTEACQKLIKHNVEHKLQIKIDITCSYKMQILGVTRHEKIGLMHT